MRRLSKKAVALFGGAVLMTLAWPGPSTADTSLGGYSATAQAEAVRIKIYEPVIPIPADPQIDGGIGYTKSNTETGPVTRGTASYLWPGDVVGDGFEALSGTPGSTYPVQVNSRYPATKGAPAHNTAQLSDGNGMTTSSDGWTTTGTVNGLGVSGSDPLGSPLAGLCNVLLGSKCKSAPPLPMPVPVGAGLAALATMQNVYSQSSIALVSKTITATANTKAAGLSLLSGLITIGSVDVTAQSVSDGSKATPSGSAKITGLKIAGQAVDLGDKQLPNIVLDLSAIGIEIRYLQVHHTAAAATASQDAQGMIITVDTKKLKTALALNAVTDPLSKLVAQIPKIGNGLQLLLQLGPKIVIDVGDVSANATASPAYVPGSYPTGTPPPPYTGTGGVTNPGTSGNGALGGVTGPVTNPTTGPTTNPTTNPGNGQQVAFNLPGLGRMPRWLIIGGLVLAGAIGWLFRAGGGFLLAGGRNCAYGLNTGVPDLRKV